jgi:hypothetical protein
MTVRGAAFYAVREQRPETTVNGGNARHKAWKYDRIASWPLEI